MTPEFADWLEALAADGGKGVVGNIDARSLGRVAALLREQAAEVERQQRLIKFLEETELKLRAEVDRAALEPKP